MPLLRSMNVQLTLRNCYQKEINYDHPECDGETTERREGCETRSTRFDQAWRASHWLSLEVTAVFDVLEENPIELRIPRTHLLSPPSQWPPPRRDISSYPICHAVQYISHEVLSPYHHTVSRPLISCKCAVLSSHESGKQ